MSPFPRRKNLYLVGMSFRTAPVELRETASLDLDALHASVEKVDGDRALDAVALATCNRNEVYVASLDAVNVSSWLDALRSLRPDHPFCQDSSPVYRLRGQQAARHLFRVACGLDSAILGDAQILGQVRRAMTASMERGLLGSFLQRTFALAVGTGAHVRRETEIGKGAASIGSAVASMLAERFDASKERAHPEIVILGAGEIARDVARGLEERASPHLSFINRTESRAVELASKRNGRALPWDCLETSLVTADVVVSAVHCSTPILTRKQLDRIAEQRQRPLLVVDLSMPRSVDPGSQCELIDIDHVQQRRDSTLARRRAAAVRVERMVEEALVQWRRFHALQSAEARIKNLYHAASEVSRQAGCELAALGTIDSREAERLILKSIKRLLHAHVRDLRELGAGWSDEGAGEH